MRALVLALALTLTVAPGHAAPASTAGPRPTRGPTYGGEALFRTGLHLGLMLSGRRTRAWPTAKLVAKTAAGSALVVGGMASWLFTGLHVMDLGHPVIGTALYMIPLVSTANPFLPMPGSNLLLLGSMVVDGFHQGWTGRLRR